MEDIEKATEIFNKDTVVGGGGHAIVYTEILSNQQCSHQETREKWFRGRVMSLYKCSKLLLFSHQKNCYSLEFALPYFFHPPPPILCELIFGWLLYI
jgi:hypothetical protein